MNLAPLSPESPPRVFQEPSVFTSLRRPRRPGSVLSGKSCAEAKLCRSFQKEFVSLGNSHLRTTPAQTDLHRSRPFVLRSKSPILKPGRKYLERVTSHPLVFPQPAR